MAAGMSTKQINDRIRYRLLKAVTHLKGIGVEAEYKAYRVKAGPVLMFFRILRASNGEVAGVPTGVNEETGKCVEGRTFPEIYRQCMEVNDEQET